MAERKSPKRGVVCCECRRHIVEDVSLLCRHGINKQTQYYVRTADLRGGKGMNASVQRMDPALTPDNSGKYIPVTRSVRSLTRVVQRRKRDGAITSLYLDQPSIGNSWLVLLRGFSIRTNSM